MLTKKEVAKKLKVDVRRVDYLRRTGGLPYAETGSGKDLRFIPKKKSGESANIQKQNLKEEKIAAEIIKLRENTRASRMIMAEEISEIFIEKLYKPLLLKLQPILKKTKNEKAIAEWKKALTNGLQDDLNNYESELKNLITR